MNTPKPGIAALLPAVLLATAFSALPRHAEAGVFSVTPVRIFMQPRDRAVAITLTNEGDTEVALQADINVWTQKPDGSDDLVLTEDLILSPPIIKLAPKARQVVRLALLKPADASRQLTYRMIVREVPEATAASDKTIDVPIALALSLPVFITPPVAKREVSCTAARGAAQALVATCANTGTAYAQIREVTFKRGEQQLARLEGGTYILPGASRPLSANSTQAVPPGPMQVTVTFDDGKSQSFEAALP
ncbi:MULTISPECIES: molecular chaperone [unclassified Polaromonas]|uniref:fimbrial biogenesis chaperone n=1 Tax=unclassified Polaromonas TaxID=2638319 RepID=UPI000F087230|nr:MULTISPECIES: fimbria/pilus periplasmic chaperone [unclassified Polaromonas]AYQ27314.1 molecular chaperone [Polaromonas sp. SP1]QGJ17844.1 fimbria/pilus periplasmic chaperone [Polaromonas sp. Pch-P]